MDGIEDNMEQEGVMNLWKKRSINMDIFLFSGIYPHLQKIEFDKAGEQISCFIDYNKIAIMPLLHQNDLKLRCPGGKKFDET